VQLGVAQNADGMKVSIIRGRAQILHVTGTEAAVRCVDQAEAKKAKRSCL
jgi:hypothetical protein